MTKEEILQECQTVYASNRKNEERLKELKSICKHKYTTRCDYAYTMTMIMPAIVCDHCNKVVDNLMEEMINGTVLTTT